MGDMWEHCRLPGAPELETQGPYTPKVQQEGAVSQDDLSAGCGTGGCRHTAVRAQSELRLNPGSAKPQLYHLG